MMSLFIFLPSAVGFFECSDSHLNAASPLALCGQSWRHALVICLFLSQHRTVPAITLCFNRKKCTVGICLTMCVCSSVSDEK